MTRMTIGVLGIVSLGLTACAKPQLHGASQVGDHEPATWVYVSTNDRELNGIFRCVEASGQVVCKRARIEK